MFCLFASKPFLVLKRNILQSKIPDTVETRVDIIVGRMTSDGFSEDKLVLNAMTVVGII